MSKWAYDMTNEELVNELASACARSGASNSGLCIDIMASSNAEMAQYLKSVVLSRLDGAKPPFRRGDKIFTLGDVTAERLHPPRMFEPLPFLAPDAVFVVKRVHYHNKRWQIELDYDFKGIEGKVALFRPSDFKLTS